MSVFYQTTLSVLFVVATGCLIGACAPPDNATSQNIQADAHSPALFTLVDGAEKRLDIYHQVPLTANLNHLSLQQKAMLAILIDAAKIMDELFWQQALGQSPQPYLAQISNSKVKEFVKINYGPWDRLNADNAIFSDTPKKALGANFYPIDMTKEEFNAAQFEDKQGLYSMVRRQPNGQLFSIPYSAYFADSLKTAASLLKQAAKLADNQAFANYLRLRAKALLSNQYQESDLAWMDMKNNPIELVYGPIETYEDQLFGYRAAFEAYVLIKDMDWSEKLSQYAGYLPELQKGLPVSPEYKAQMPGANADLNAYDVIYYAGHSNAGSKTIAINLPNDEEVQLQKGTRRLQLKNAMQAKFEHILLPISNVLITPEQRKHITFNAFFANTMFHEVAHGLGIKNVLNSEQTVRQALKEHASALEEGKADILGLYMVQQLLEKGAIREGLLKDYYVTFMAGIFRSVRFGASSAHGKANMIRFNFFEQHQAFSRDNNGLYQVNMDKMQIAINALSEKILTLQGNGDYQGVAKLVAELGHIKPALQEDLGKLTQAAIPVDIDFKQGKDILGL